LDKLEIELDEVLATLTANAEKVRKLLASVERVVGFEKAYADGMTTAADRLALITRNDRAALVKALNAINVTIFQKLAQSQSQVETMVQNLRAAGNAAKSPLT
jgi:hypothetical protein